MGLLGKDKELADAAGRGDLKQVMEYAKLWGDPKFNHSEALRRAAMEGHTQVVAFLLPLSDPNAERGFALKTASVRGYTPCVRLLLDCTNLNGPSDSKMNIGAHALYCAAKEGHYEIVDLIFERIGSADVAVAIECLSGFDPHCDYVRDKLLARTQHQTLNSAIGNVGVEARKKM